MKRFLAALTCCGLLALSSCSDDSSSSADPPSPTPTSTSSEPSPTQEAETPEEFVRRWVEADTRDAEHRGNGGVPRDLAWMPSMHGESPTKWRGYYDAGGYVKTDGWSIKSVKVSKPGAKGRVTVTIDSRVGAH